MPTLIDLTGKRFGRLTVIRREANYKRETQWLCRCDCGNERIAQGVNLRGGAATRCNLCSLEAFRGMVYKHGLRHHPLYVTWKNIKQRCLNPTNPAYRNYGGRGIGVCAGWVGSFVQFLADVERELGDRPSNPTGWRGKRAAYTIDRIDNDGDYEPGNIRWATFREQRLNQGRMQRPDKGY